MMYTPIVYINADGNSRVMGISCRDFSLLVGVYDKNYPFFKKIFLFIQNK